MLSGAIILKGFKGRIAEIYTDFSRRHMRKTLSCTRLECMMWLCMMVMWFLATGSPVAPFLLTCFGHTAVPLLVPLTPLWWLTHLLYFHVSCAECMPMMHQTRLKRAPLFPQCALPPDTLASPDFSHEHL